MQMTRLLVFESVDKESPGSCATVEATLQQCLCQFLSFDGANSR